MKYLQDPGLREREARANAQQVQAYRENAALNGKSTSPVGEWWAKQKLEYKIGVGVVLVAVILGGTFLVGVDRQAKQAETAVDTAAARTRALTDAVTARKGFAAVVRQRYAKMFPMIEVTTSGETHRSLFLNDSKITHKFVDEYKQVKNLEELRILKFDSVEFSNGKQKWTISP